MRLRIVVSTFIKIHLKAAIYCRKSKIYVLVICRADHKIPIFSERFLYL